MKTIQTIFISLIFLLAGLGLSYYAYSSIKTYKEKNATFIETTSTVVDYKYNDEGLQAIVVEYVVDGKTYQKISNSYSNMPKSIGTTVSIKYNPALPQDSIWSSDSSNIILPVVGILFTLIGAIMLFSGIKNRNV